ncbi:MAG: hypothetical protein HYS62_01100 [Candidatus Aenigmarchaeota archaeon]|nr:hypothetical protein [Candidatus Aenigmarchaeota archaeon]
MDESIVKDTVLILFGIVGAVITFWIFGVELPLYLILAIAGLLLYVYSSEPAWKFAGGFVGRLFATLFLISLLYYFGTRTFFPPDPFNFRFLIVGVQFTIEFLSALSNFIGKLVLSLIDIIIP